MKKISLLVMSITLMLGLHAQSNLVFLGGDTVGVGGSAGPSNMVVGQGNLKNNGTSASNVVWEIIDSIGPQGWEFSGFCDKNNCYAFVQHAQYGFTLAPGESGVMKFDLYGHCVPGTGRVKVLLWDVADSANSARVITYNIALGQSIMCANGINDIAVGQIALFPNPVKSQLHVSLPQSMDNAKIEIYNLLGSKVLAQNLSGTSSKEIDLTGVDSGIYMARVYDNGRIIATKRFTKE